MKRNRRTRTLHHLGQIWWARLLKTIDLKFPVLLNPLSKADETKVRSSLQPGDILLLDCVSYPLGQIAAQAVGSSYSHSAFYIGHNIAIDAGTKPYVAEVGLDELLSNCNVAVYRPEYGSPEDLQSALKYIKSCVGKRFNTAFDLSSKNSYYCTQLLFSALEQMPHPISIPTVRIVLKSVVLPSCVEKCRLIRLVCKSKRRRFLNVLCQLPIVAACVGGAVVGSLWGRLGSIVGAVAAATILLALANTANREKKNIVDQCRRTPTLH